MGLHTTAINVSKTMDNAIILEGMENNTNEPLQLLTTRHEQYDRFLTIELDSKTTWFGLGFSQTAGRTSNKILILASDINNISDFVSKVNEYNAEKKTVFNIDIIHTVGNRDLLIPSSTIDKMLDNKESVLILTHPERFMVA